jgi:hypothetical protein
MTENAALRTGEFLRIAISFLWNKPGGASTREIMQAIARSTRLTEEESSPVQDGTDFYRYEITTRSAMTALEKAGWLVREQSQWLLTEEGRLVCKDFRHAQDFYIESQRILENLRLIRPVVHLTIEYAREMARQQMRSYLQNLTHHEFRFLVQDLLLAMGQTLDWVAPPGKTRGHVDMIAIPDPLRTGGQQLLVQIRHTGQMMTAEELAMLVSETHEENLVLCICTGGFAEDAVHFASSQAHARVVLMDLDKFTKLWIEYYNKLTPDARQRLPLEEIHFLSLAD